MNCPNCTAELKQGAAFCGKCGSSVQHLWKQGAGGPALNPTRPALKSDWDDIPGNEQGGDASRGAGGLEPTRPASHFGKSGPVQGEIPSGIFGITKPAGSPPATPEVDVPDDFDVPVGASWGKGGGKGGALEDDVTLKGKDKGGAGEGKDNLDDLFTDEDGGESKGAGHLLDDEEDHVEGDTAEGGDDDLDRLSSGKTRVVYEDSEQRGRTLVLKTTGQRAQKHYEVTGVEFFVGREKGDCLLPFDPYVSPRHARFHYKGKRFLVEDLGSRNGTYRRLREGELYPIEDGEHVLMGSQMFRYESMLGAKPARIAPDESLEKNEDAAIDLLQPKTAETPPPPAPPSPEAAAPAEGQDNDTWYLGSPDPRPSFRLVKVLRNQYDGPSYYHTWGTECLVGRTQGQHRFNRDTSMSGRHAALIVKDGRVYLEDRKSTNGTYVRIKEPWVLERGDAVKIGEQVLEVLA